MHCRSSSSSFVKILDQDLVIVGPLGATHLRIRPGSARFALSPILISTAINIIIIIMKGKDVGLIICFFNTRGVFEMIQKIGKSEVFLVMLTWPVNSHNFMKSKNDPFSFQWTKIFPPLSSQKQMSATSTREICFDSIAIIIIIFVIFVDIKILILSRGRADAFY